MASLTFLYGQSVARCNHNIDKVFDTCTLQYMASGSVALSIGEHERLMKGRWFWSCYPGPRIKFRASSETPAIWHHHYVAFGGELVRAWEAEGLFPVPPQSPPFGADYSSRFDEMLALSRREDRWGTRRAINMLEGILIELAEWRNRSSDDALVSRAISLLHESADEALACGELAGHLGTSQRTLRRRFRTATGHSPQQYLIQQRTATARRLLAETDLPIKQIAEQLRYKDVFFFTRQFTRATGVPPGEYRRSCAG